MLRIRLCFGPEGMKRLLPLICVLAGCATHTPTWQLSDEEMLSAASALTKVAFAVDGATRYGDLPDGATDDELLARATEDDPDLLRPFAQYRVLVRRQGTNSEVLLCTADLTKALIEDAGCSAPSDVHHWKTLPLPPCAFVLNLEAVCQGK